ncbi:MAG TPA: hypothetical protein VNZ26_23520, partial [Vicinamibacterales bacterium]|nr:hypothetical protein [Vicinamibacterales bacterium]
MPPVNGPDPELVYKVVTLFFAGKNASQIRDALKPEYGDHLTRESIYPLLAKARGLGMVRLVPPLEGVLATRLKEHFPRARNAEIVVVKTRGPEHNEAVSAAAADLALDLVQELGRKGHSTVGIGFGPGKSGLDFARSLSASLDATSGVPTLDLFGITAGCIASAPQFAPVS